MSKTLAYDPRTGVKQTFVAKDDGTFDIVTSQIVDPIMELAWEDKKAIRGPGPKYQGDGFHRVAWVDMPTLSQWMVEGRLGDEDFIKDWLNDPENSRFRTTTGKV